jgi:hypothetical protein
MAVNNFYLFKEIIIVTKKIHHKKVDIYYKSIIMINQSSAKSLIERKLINKIINLKKRWKL